MPRYVLHGAHSWIQAVVTLVKFLTEALVSTKVNSWCLKSRSWLKWAIWNLVILALKSPKPRSVRFGPKRVSLKLCRWGSKSGHDPYRLKLFLSEPASNYLRGDGQRDELRARWIRQSVCMFSGQPGHSLWGPDHWRGPNDHSCPRCRPREQLPLKIGAKLFAVQKHWKYRLARQ